MKNYVYSSACNAFFPIELRASYDAAGTWPNDGIEVDDATFAEFSGEPPAGKIRTMGSDGLPCWIDIPPPSDSERIAAAEAEKRQLLVTANATIATLADAVEFDMATPAERQLYDEWRRYRVLLTRVDTAAATVNWPPSPAE